jgi:hypothetical protein
LVAGLDMAEVASRVLSPFSLTVLDLGMFEIVE